jgi:hypothetical protein
MPPTVQKQSPSHPIPISKSENILNLIRPVAEHDSGGLKMNVYGRNGSGKTTFACTFPKPLIIIGFEDGTQSVKQVKGVDFVPIRSSADLHPLADYIRSEENPTKRYKTVVLDTATSLQDLMLKEILNLQQMKVQLAWGTVSQKQYQERSEKTKEFLRLFLNLAQWGFNVVVLAQEKNHTQKDGEGGGDSELLTPFIASSLGSSTCGWLQENCDNICQTFTREATTVEKIPVGEGFVETHKKTGKIEFCLRTQRAHPIYGAKIRADKHVQLPDVLVDPTYDKFARLLEGGK